MNEPEPLWGALRFHFVKENSMIVELVVVAAVAAVGYFVGTKSGKIEGAKLVADVKADAAKVKAAVVAALPKIEASVDAVEAKAKADVLAVVADLKKLF
jgi:hypothetical protein